MQTAATATSELTDPIRNSFPITLDKQTNKQIKRLCRIEETLKTWTNHLRPYDKTQNAKNAAEAQ
jgi:hypothetical protein